MPSVLFDSPGTDCVKALMQLAMDGIDSITPNDLFCFLKGLGWVATPKVASANLSPLSKLR